MKQILLILSFAAIGIGIHAQEVIVMDKAMFIDKVFDYTDSKATENTRATVPPSSTSTPIGAVLAAA